jgi:hypothetical protein
MVQHAGHLATYARAAQAWQLEKAVLASTTAMAEKAYSLLQVFAAFKPHKHKRAVASHTLLRAVCAVQSCVALRMAMPTDRVRVGVFCVATVIPSTVAHSVGAIMVAGST